MHFTKPHLLKSALLTIDVQNDFTLEGAPAEIAGTRRVLPQIVSLLEVYRAHGLPIVHIVRLYRPDGSNVDLCRRQMILDGTQVVAPGTRGAELVSELCPQGFTGLDQDFLLANGIQEIGYNEVVIYKPRWGAFYETPLESHLCGLPVDTLTFCGCNFPNCPRTSIYEASERDFRLILVSDAVSGFYDQGKDELTKIGVWVTSSEEITFKMAAEQAGASERLLGAGDL